jgi:hypothetical protein
MKPSRGSEGQAVAEFALVLPLLAAVLLACASAWRAEWDRAICAYRAFQLAHARLIREDVAGNAEKDVSVALQCGGARESLSLLKLEHVRW